MIHSQDLDERKDVAARIADFGNGTYLASYTATLSGRYQTIVSLDGVAINGSCPASCLAVLPPSTEAGSTLLSGGGLTAATAGTPGAFFIFSRDLFGNRRTTV